MNKKTLFLCIYILFLLLSGNSFARPVNYYERSPLLDSMSDSHYNSTAIVSFDVDFPKIDNSITLAENSLNWEPLSDYPYVLMSYFSEMYKLDSSDEGKREAIFKRLHILKKKYGFNQMVVDEVPVSIRNLYKEKNKQNRIYDRESGLKARLFINKKENTIVLAIAGTDLGLLSMESLNSIGSAVYLGNGGVSAPAAKALQLIKALERDYQGYSLKMTGASQGGAIAQYVAINSTAEAFVFNSQGLPAYLTGKLSREQLGRLHHTYVEGEILNSKSAIPKLASFLVQNPVPVEGYAIPVDDVLDIRMTEAFFKKANALSYYVTYYITPESFIRHWTGSILEAVEYYAGFDELPSLQ
ncbi:hypothetical protein [Endozoicomonas sp. Mp262]|uniref:hypothetical protein n=1 Tax=Endozoicomonas sp. Mp262 TaxID=2919499 RepID=UPI0021DB402A